jgi:tripartite-type tricarboxylate transporter receptor subunit TctC
LNAEIRRILSEPEVKQRWQSIGLEPRPTTPGEFDKIIADEITTFTKIARSANIRAD